MNPNEFFQDYKWLHIYRARVIEAKDPEKEMRVKIWVPDLMPEVDKESGIWARPGNNPLGGRNYGDEISDDGDDHFYQGSCLIPPKGSWVYIFFENGNPNEARYFGACDIGRTKAPIENQQGSEWHKKWTLFKSRDGRTIIVSDDPDDARVEITGKKRLLTSENPSGNEDSVYTIDTNQNTILMDERKGKEKIIIKDYKGNYINMNITKSELHIHFDGDIHQHTNSDYYLDVAGSGHIRFGENLSVTVGDDVNFLVGGDYKLTSENQDHVSRSNVQFKATGEFNVDASKVQHQMGSASGTPRATSSGSSRHNGDREDPDTTVPLIDDDPKNLVSIPETIR